MTKKVYSYDSETLLFTDASEARESPLEEGVFLLPANATFVAPPATKENQGARFIAGKWIIVPSFIGQTFYDTLTQKPVVIQTFGLPDSNLTAIQPSDGACVWTGSRWEKDLLLSLEQAKSAKINEMSLLSVAEGKAPATITTEGGVTGTFKIIYESGAAINAALATYNAIGQVPDGYYWVDDDNNQVPFTLNDLKALALAATGWVSFDKFQKLKAAINACKNEVEVGKIVWS